ncbi:efflux RND transporter permease subunit [Parvularcula sp. ZS-1/3]|uniref:Efflux RND transporter permease subunit n=1 Tax=Parvularcula mediterranea TaxID=2732508 RepID=A0A7Y3RMZ7_9PROT|nr:CusA/CzcA family heavy metal efflux RND transporter [Parvularcula mediterranea]NNU17068.1 efflux RND transporter permease subunit [Parvularcula mediterranea]
MRSIIHGIAGGQLFAALAAAAITLAGIWSFRTLPVDAFPDVTPSLVQVFTETEGLAPEEVERYVTYPLEASMSGLPKVEEIRSVSNFGLSVLNIYFEDGTDVYFARQVVGERLAEARNAIPEGFGEPQMGPISTGLGIILYYQLVDESGQRSLVEMREIQDWLIKYQLQSVPGVTEVLSLGGYEKQYQVRIQPDALLRYDLTVADVVSALNAGNRTAGAQYLELDSEQYVVRGIGLAENTADLGAAVLKTLDGTPVRVADVAEIDIGGGVRQGLAIADGQGEVVAGLVLKLYGTNTSDVIGRAKKRFDEINRTLPDGVQAVAYYDQATLVKAASSTVTTALWQGALLVAVLIFAFLGGWRPSLVVVLSIPFSVGFAFLGMKFLGVSANLMSLGGVAIAIGMMVDGAIVIAENVDRLMRERPEQERRSAVAEAVTEVLGPLLAAVAVVIVVFLPLFALEGVEGKTFRPLAASAALAMTGSLIYAGLIAPAIAGWVMRTRKERVGEMGGWIGRFIRPYAAFFVRRRSAAFGLAGVMLLAGALVFPRLGSEFTPTLEEGDILLRTTMAPSISLTEAEATMTRVEQRILDSFPEVERIVTRIGRGEVGAHADPTNSGESFLALKPRNAWRPRFSPDDLRAALSEELSDFPGILVNVSQPIAMSVDELLTGTKAELAVKIFGPDTDELIAAGGRLQTILQEVRGASDVQMDQVTGAPQLQIDLDRQALSRFGITVDQALSTVRTAIGGEEAGTLFEGVRQFPIVVRYTETRRDTPEAVRRLVIKAPDGALVPLEAVADVRQVVGPRQITREDGQRFITVQANVRGRDIGSFVEEAQGLTADGLDLPPGYRVVWGGQFELQQQANKRFAVVIPITLGIVLLILLVTFGRLKPALLILSNIPLALVGGVIALWVAGLPVSVPATVGFIALFGIALGNGMVLVSYLDRFAREGRPLDALAVDGAVLRARPVLMTALTTALGLGPLLFATGVGAEVQRPLATVVVGGLVPSTALTLLVLPALHRWFAPGAGSHETDESPNPAVIRPEVI